MPAIRKRLLLVRLECFFHGEARVLRRSELLPAQQVARGARIRHISFRNSIDGAVHQRQAELGVAKNAKRKVPIGVQEWLLACYILCSYLTQALLALSLLASRTVRCGGCRLPASLVFAVAQRGALFICLSVSSAIAVTCKMTQLTAIVASSFLVRRQLLVRGHCVAVGTINMTRPR